MKRIVISISILFLVFVMFSLNVLVSVNYIDEIRNSDEYLIKSFRSHHNYSIKELKQLEIEYLGEVDGYRIYFVPSKGKGSWTSDPWIKDGYTFPSESHTLIGSINSSVIFV